MPVPFPKIHIAESALNRILNALEGESALGLPQLTPTPPNPTLEGVVLDEKLDTPDEPVGVPPDNQSETEQSMVESSLLGGSPFDGALVGAAGDESPAGLFGS